MNSSKKIWKVFSADNYQAEEDWLSAQHAAGLKLADLTGLGCLYQFETCAPERVVYRVDRSAFLRVGHTVPAEDYLTMFADYGWEYVTSCNGFNYFRKPLCEEESGNTLFSDPESQDVMINRIIRFNIVPALIALVVSVMATILCFLVTALSLLNILLAAIDLLLAVWIIRILVRLLRRKKTAVTDINIDDETRKQNRKYAGFYVLISLLLIVACGAAGFVTGFLIAMFA